MHFTSLLISVSYRYHIGYIDIFIFKNDIYRYRTGIVSVISISLLNKSINIGIVSVSYRLYRYGVSKNDNSRYLIGIVSVISVCIFNKSMIIGIVSLAYQFYRYDISKIGNYRYRIGIVSVISISHFKIPILSDCL